MTGLWVARLQAPLLSPPDLLSWLPGRDRLAAATRLADAGADPALAERQLVSGRGVAAVGPELLGMDAGLSEPLEQRQQVAPLVLVARRERDRKRQPARIDG